MVTMPGTIHSVASTRWAPSGGLCRVASTEWAPLRCARRRWTPPWCAPTWCATAPGAPHHPTTPGTHAHPVRRTRCPAPHRCAHRRLTPCPGSGGRASPLDQVRHPERFPLPGPVWTFRQTVVKGVCDIGARPCRGRRPVRCAWAGGAHREGRVVRRCAHHRRRHRTWCAWCGAGGAHHGGAVRRGRPTVVRCAGDARRTALHCHGGTATRWGGPPGALPSPASSPRPPVGAGHRRRRHGPR